MYIFIIFYSYNFARPHKLQSFNFNHTKIKVVCLLKTYNKYFIAFTNFQHTIIYFFQNLSLRFILKIFLKYSKF